MAARLVSMRNMMEDEVEDIRALLDDNRIDYYETPAGLMGLNPPTIWLHDSAELTRARELLQHYNAARTLRVRAELEQQRQRGELRSWRDELRDNPLRVLTYFAFIVFLIYITLGPFWGLF